MHAISTSTARHRIVEYAFEHPEMPLAKMHTAQLPPRNSNTWISFAEYISLCKNLEANRRDQLTALRLGLSIRLRFAGAVGFLALNQPNLRRALMCLCQNSDLLMRGAQLKLEEAGPVAGLTYRVDAPASAVRFDVELMIAGLVTTLRDHAPDVHIRQVSLRCDPGCALPEMRRLLQTRCVAGPETNAIFFDARALDRPMCGADPELCHTLGLMIGVSESNGDGKHLLSRLRSELRQRLADQNCRIDTVAAALNTTPRTLQRHLSDAGYTFSSLREEIRRERATIMITQSEQSIAEISFSLGFTEVSSFYRSFRSWTGMTPGKFRNQALRKAAYERASLAIDKIADGDDKPRA